jgi:ATP-dependent helicase HrpA
MEAPANDSLDAAISECMLADQPALRQRLAHLSGDAGRSNERRSDRIRLRHAIARSSARRKRRLENLPSAVVPDPLPIHAWCERIAETVMANAVTIVCGETGSGKTTQLPKICLKAGRGVAGLIGHTQPRRVAARGVAARIAEELGSMVGKAVGHKVRFDRDVDPDCYIKVMTDGILLAEIQTDPMLSAYDTIIIDEAHERSLNVDFLLGYLKLLLPERPELRLIVSSATIDTQRFSDYFNGAPVVEVEGRTYPVEVRYQPAEETDPLSDDRVVRAVSAISNLWAKEPGDILAFFPGERDIHDALGKLRGKQIPDAEILPLYARLPLPAQRRALESAETRRIVLSTNVAETSVTVPKVRCVVDTGVARISRYNRHSGVSRLPVEPVSRASADQRKGRCGRIGPGICVRLYSEENFQQRAEFTEPEILRSNLAAVLLRMRALGLKDLAEFPFIDPPSRRHVNDGLRLLRELRALDEDDELTSIGQRLARLPLEPRLGRMLLAAEQQDCVSDVLVIAAALSVADPRLRPPGRESAADAAHRRYADERSDFLSLLNLWDLYHTRTRGLSDDSLHAFCRKRFLSLSRMREWRDVHDQLKQIAAELGLRRGRRGAAYARIHKALLTGLLRNVGFLNAEREYTGVRGANFRVAPGSAQHAAQAKWIMAAELVETSRLYAFIAARIRPEWIEDAAGDLIRKTYFNAHWDRGRGQCMVYEQCALYGLTVIPRRRRRYTPVCPEEARRIFIRSALVDGQLDSPAGFLKHNREVIGRLRGYEDRLRQPDALISNEDLHEFYDHRVPSRVCDSRSFERWNRDMGEREFDDLCLDEQSLTDGKLGDGFKSRFPDRLHVGGYRFRLEYRFAPGTNADGLSVVLPVELLGELDPGPFSWLVPGYLEEKVQAMLKSLPKSHRRELAPVSHVVSEFLARCSPADGPIATALRMHLRRMRGVDVAENDWDESRLPDHLRMNFVVAAADGALLGHGRELAELQRRFARRPAGRTAEAPLSIARQTFTDWHFGDIPEAVEKVRRGARVRLYPGLEDRGDAVALTLSESRDHARRAHCRGVCRLFMLTRRREIHRLGKNLPGLDWLSLGYALVDNAPPDWMQHDDAGNEPPRNGPAGLADDIAWAGSMRALEAVAGLEVRTKSAFAEASEAAAAGLDPAVTDISALCEEVLSAFRAIRMTLDHGNIAAREESLADIRMHLESLVYRGFVAAVPYQSLKHYPRFLKAIERRIEKLKRGGARDFDKVASLTPLWLRYLARRRNHASRGRRDEELDQYRWMIEEYRVSLFAQEIGTAYPVSRQRLDRQWTRVAP